MRRLEENLMKSRFHPFLIVVLVLAALACTCSLPLTTTPEPADPETLPDTVEPLPSPGDAALPDGCAPAPVVGDPVGLETYEQAMRAGLEADAAEYGDEAQYQVSLIASRDTDPLCISGAERVTYRNTTGQPLNEVVFRLYPNALDGGAELIVHQVSANETQAQGELSERRTTLTVQLPDALPPGETAALDLVFTLTLPDDSQIGYGRMANTQGIVMLSSFLPMLSVYDADGWWTEWPEELGDPAYSSVALFDVTLLAPEEMQVASSGSSLSAEPDAAEPGMTRRRFVTGPMRDFAVAYSADFELSSGEANGVAIHIWSFPGDQAEDDAALAIAQESIRAYDDAFGLYPYNQLDVVEAPVLALGIEYPGLIYIADHVWDTEDSLYRRWVISHEVGHQWWYGVVGNNQTAEPWLDEGLTEYAVEVYFYATDGERAAQDARDNYQAELDDYVASNDTRLPVGLPVSEYGNREYRVFVYSAGALFYNGLEDRYGREAVLDFLKRYYERFRYDVVDNGELEALVVEVFGADAADYFKEWVYEGDG
jgi:hypothetical protein